MKSLFILNWIGENGNHGRVCKGQERKVFVVAYEVGLVDECMRQRDF